MAVTANSTLAPSRRDFFGSAAGAGWAAAQPPIFTAALFAADAALVALGARAAELIEESNRAWREVTAAEEMIQEATGPVPVRPGGPGTYWMPSQRFADTMRRYEIDKATYDSRVAQLTLRVNFEGLEAAGYAADEAMSDACFELAALRATTLEGLVAKARAAGSYNRAGLRDSIVADLLALTP